METIIKKGEKFEKTYTTHYGKKINCILTVVLIDGSNILFDNGAWYNILDLTKKNII